MKIKELLKDLEYTWLQGSEETEVTGICHDNRKARPGDAFVCITGARHDSHDFVMELAEKGVSLLIVEKEIPLPEGTAAIRVSDTRLASPLLAAAFYGHPADRMVTVAVTGSKGKTTVTHMMADVFRAAGYRTGTIGTNGAILPRTGVTFGDIPGADQMEAIDCAETPGHDCYELSNTTPDAMEVQMYLAMMAKAGCTHVVIEVSSQGMKQHRVDGITFGYGIWTNIETGDHIGPTEHKDFEEYLTCKAMMINHSRIGFVNCDDVHAADFLSHVELSDGSDGREKRLFRFGCGADADYRGYGLEECFDETSRQPGIRFGMHGKTEKEIFVNLPGTFNMYNALPVISIAEDLGISDEVINKALSALRIRGRFDIVFKNDHFQVCVDFAHNGYSTRNHLKALREYRPKRLVCVFGADGNRSRYRRYEMGEASALLADLSIVTAGHNRYETFEQIMADIQQGIDKAQAAKKEPVSYLVIPNRQNAIRYAIEHAEEGDMITILGLGHESYQEENGVKYPHSDIDFARQCCRELGLL
ncbi:MAG: UDP-N-acetylmuramoyl-L-alanyl-D-glutamate--2,6-diaminopimelate ligase [Lachnospiraceae bacterium]|nr:UDP-N-acetylmuramoyl-L-alanyl-D-glutamate--2,6-diaminopimelate ligase [Lachnospiraceae bacterium]